MTPKSGRIWLILILLCFIQVPRSGATDEDATSDPIDRFYDECTNRDGSTAGRLACTERAERMWDAEMNRAYQKLLGLLGPGKSRTLRESQRAWLLFRDQEFQLIGDIYSLLRGTLFAPMEAYSRLRLTKERTLLLRNYVKLIAEEGGGND